MALPLSDLVAWITGLALPNSPTVYANWMPATPDSVIVVGLAGSGALLVDGHFEEVHIHVRVRDTTDALAEQTALALHAAVLGSMGTFPMGTTQVLTASPTQAPVFLLRDVDERTTYLSAYMFTVGV